MKLYLKFLIQLKNTALNKISYRDINYSNQNLKILKLFYEKGFINHYIYIKKLKIRVFSTYFNGKSIFEKLQIFQKIYSKFKFLTLFQNRKSLLINKFYLFKTISGFFLLEDILINKLQNKNLYLICKF